MHVVVIQEPVIQPDITQEELTARWETLKSFPEVESLVIDRRPAYPSYREICELSKDADALFGVWIDDSLIQKEFVSSHQKLRYIATLGHGWGSFDVPMTQKAGLTITNTVYGTQTIAEYAFALLMEVCHHVSVQDARIHSIDWTNPGNADEFCRAVVPQVELYGKTLGILGLGQIGTAMAHMAMGFGMHVLGYSRHPKEGAAYEGIEQTTDLDTLLKRSDVISLHVPHTKSTEHLIDENAIKKMKDGVILINTARGALIDEQALADALNDGKVAAAGLDVLTEEPPVHGSPLLSAKNCTITGHIAWLTRQSRLRAIDMAIENFRHYLDGKPCSRING